MAGVGVDGCKGGWLYFRLNGDATEYGVARRLEDVVERSRPGDVILADVPIGLPGPSAGERACDREARERLARSGRASSVFSVPSRRVLEAVDYEEANRVQKRLTGRGLSRQSWALAARVLEVDILMRATTEARERVREGHPELVFWGLTGGRGMPRSKKTREGFLDRMAVLERAWPGAEDLASRAFMDHGGFRVLRDDVVDALALAVVASVPDALTSVPEAREWDAHGLPMEIVFSDRPVWTDPLPSDVPG